MGDLTRGSRRSTKDLPLRRWGGAHGPCVCRRRTESWADRSIRLLGSTMADPHSVSPRYPPRQQPEAPHLWQVYPRDGRFRRELPCPKGGFSPGSKPGLGYLLLRNRAYACIALLPTPATTLKRPPPGRPASDVGANGYCPVAFLQHAALI